jgi:acetyl esterase/lipase
MRLRFVSKPPYLSEGLYLAVHALADGGALVGFVVGKFEIWLGREGGKVGDGLMRLLLWFVVLWTPVLAGQKVYRVMAVGDSITEGGSSFSNWRYPLWERLFAAGYLVEYVGTRKAASRIGDLKHEGYGGKASGFLAATVPANFRKHPADLVLLHVGHNRFAEEEPVAEILADIETMIREFREVNPAVVVLVAQPIPSSKLPKYSYLPELSRGLVGLVGRLDGEASRVLLVPQAEGFDPVKDTVADGVHPNEAGAAKMVGRWYEALVEVMEKPEKRDAPEILPYKNTVKGELTLHVFRPQGGGTGAGAGGRAAMVLFFGGGWQRGTPLQFYAECREMAERGMVAIAVDYRTAFTHGTGAFEAVADGKSALRWIRAHARELGVDPNKIVAGGASAGGQVAAAAGIVVGLDEVGEDPTVSSRPDALVLWYPVIDNGPGGYGDAEVKVRYREISPLHQIREGVPPTLMFLGTADPLVPVATAREFERRMAAAGARCVVKLYDQGGHPLYAYQKGPSELRDEILDQSEDFLRSIGMFP